MNATKTRYRCRNIESRGLNLANELTDAGSGPAEIEALRAERKVRKGSRRFAKQSKVKHRHEGRFENFPLASAHPVRLELGFAQRFFQYPLTQRSLGNLLIPAFLSGLSALRAKRDFHEEPFKCPAAQSLTRRIVIHCFYYIFILRVLRVIAFRVFSASWPFSPRHRNQPARRGPDAARDRAAAFEREIALRAVVRQGPQQRSK